MTFLSPLFLWGLTFASIPVIIHLINRRRHQTIQWAAMQFLLKATRQSRGKRKLRNIIILNAPVYVHIDFYWLNSKEMEQFEEIYFDWLKERVAIEPKQPDLDDKAQRVMDLFIKRK